MAVLFDAAGESEAGVNTGSMAWDQPVQAGENRIVLIGLAGQISTGAPNGLVVPTVDAAEATFVDAYDLGVGSGHRFEVWRYAVPGSAAGTLEVEYIRGVDMQFPAGISMAFHGVDPTAPIVDLAYTEDMAGPLVLSVDVDTLAGGMVADFACWAARIGRVPFPNTTDQTERAADTSIMSEGNNPPLLKCSTKEATGTTTTVGWANESGVQPGAMFALSLRPAATGPTPDPLRAAKASYILRQMAA